VAEFSGDVGVYALINNAGLIVQGPLETLPREAWQHQYEVNVFGPVQGYSSLSAVTAALATASRSGAGQPGDQRQRGDRPARHAYLSPISSSKAALESISDSLRVELRPWHIAVSVLQPAAIRTQIFTKASEQGRIYFDAAKPEVRALHAEAYAAIDQTTQKASTDGADPAVITRAASIALSARNPKPRYAPGAAGILIALGRLPDTIRDHLIVAQLGLRRFERSAADSV
jgi:NAD(P)-dependent dehydrogenase (short-subunit alcohol dehydrogenase family)